MYIKRVGVLFLILLCVLIGVAIGQTVDIGSQALLIMATVSVIGTGLLYLREWGVI